MPFAAERIDSWIAGKSEPHHFNKLLLARTLSVRSDWLIRGIGAMSVEPIAVGAESDFHTFREDLEAIADFPGAERWTVALTPRADAAAAAGNYGLREISLNAIEERIILTKFRPAATDIPWSVQRIFLRFSDILSVRFIEPETGSDVDAPIG